MTRTEAKELLAENVVPVILSNGVAAQKLSWTLFFKYGISSVLCGERKSLLNYINFNCGFLHLLKFGDDALVVRQLKDFSEKWNECILLLVPAGAEDEGFIEKHSAELESFYILSRSSADIYDLPLMKLAFPER